jgi:hypothetical protein
MRYSQPQSGPAQIDWSNPITRGLVLAFIPGIGDATRICQRLNSYAIGAGRFGKQTVPLTAAPFPELGARNVKNGGAMSVIIFGTFAVASSFTAPLLSHYPGSGGWKFGVDASGNIGYTHYGVADYATTVPITGFTGSIGMTATISSAARMFKGGAFQQSVTIGAINSAGVSGNFSIGARFGPADSTSASVVALALYFERALSDAEQASLAANPWQVFESPQPIYLYSTAAAGGATDTPVNPAAASITVSGYAPTIARTAHQSVAPSAGSIAITGYAPSITQSAAGSISPATGAITVTGYAPTVTRTASLALSPAVGAITITGYAPTVFQGVPAVIPNEYGATIMRATPVYSVAKMADTYNQIANLL